MVLDGLKAGEQVMVDGFQKLQMMPPGAPVKPVPWTAAGAGRSRRRGAGGRRTAAARRPPPHRPRK